jgi:hypothetical protein
MSGHCRPVPKRTSRELGLVFPEIHPPWPRVAHKELCSTGRTVDRVVFAFKIFTRVLINRNTGITALLGAVVDETVFTNIEVAAPRVTMLVVGSTLRQIFIKALIERQVIEGLGEI